MLQAEILLFWTAFALYIVAAAVAIFSSALKRPPLMTTALWIATFAVALHASSTLLRWIAVGHGPYITRYEGMSSNALAAVAVLLLLQLRWQQLRSVLPYVMSAIVVIMGVAALSSKGAQPLPLTFQSYWLVVHIWFAKFANGALLLGAACAGAYLYMGAEKRRAAAEVSQSGQAVPDASHPAEAVESGKTGLDSRAAALSGTDGASELEWLDEFSYKLTAFGFIFLALMIGAGSLWANQSWGSYWSWDAVETWSLATWVTYGVYLHLRGTFGWKGRNAAYLLLACLGLAIVSLFFIGVIYTSLHREFLGPT